MNIAFDMDGTIADLYGVENWLDMIKAESARPYEIAKPLGNMQLIARLLHKAQKLGHKVGIISWTARGGSASYNKKVSEAKQKWLSAHLSSVKFDFIHIVEYGTPKHTLSDGILFDDEKPNRDIWGNGAYQPQDIVKVLKSL